MNLTRVESSDPYKTSLPRIVVGLLKVKKALRDQKHQNMAYPLLNRVHTQLGSFKDSAEAALHIGKTAIGFVNWKLSQAFTFAGLDQVLLLNPVLKPKNEWNVSKAKGIGDKEGRFLEFANNGRSFSLNLGTIGLVVSKIVGFAGVFTAIKAVVMVSRVLGPIGMAFSFIAFLCLLTAYSYEIYHDVRFYIRLKKSGSSFLSKELHVSREYVWNKMCVKLHKIAKGEASHFRTKEKGKLIEHERYFRKKIDQEYPELKAAQRQDFLHLLQGEYYALAEKKLAILTRRIGPDLVLKLQEKKGVSEEEIQAVIRKKFIRAVILLVSMVGVMGLLTALDLAAKGALTGTAMGSILSL